MSLLRQGTKIDRNSDGLSGSLAFYLVSSHFADGSKHMGGIWHADIPQHLDLPNSASLQPPARSVDLPPAKVRMKSCS